jgi:hypothetical protein
MIIILCEGRKLDAKDVCNKSAPKAQDVDYAYKLVD